MTDNGYSETVLDHIIHPHNFGEMEGADGHARVTGPCGDTMEMWLRVKGDTITEIAFMPDGCATTIASASMATALAEGKTVAEALGISQDDILVALEGLPEGNQHCALLAANTLHATLQDYLVMRQSPWKKAYRQ